ncbi:hypothetical protein D4R99_01210 [bacterium]|nr:MAG: hypothetical protein D4R99_01210 [bacterium]
MKIKVYVGSFLFVILTTGGSWWFLQQNKITKDEPASIPINTGNEKPVISRGDKPKDVVSQKISCPEKRNGESSACTEQYDPVCAEVQVQCFSAPCPPIPQTFGNSCEACRNSLVDGYTKGECVK